MGALPTSFTNFQSKEQTMVKLIGNYIKNGVAKMHENIIHMQCIKENGGIVQCCGHGSLAAEGSFQRTYCKI